MRARAVLLAALVGPVAWLGCSGRCTSSKDCPSGQACNYGVCQKGCAISDCPTAPNISYYFDAGTRTSSRADAAMSTDSGAADGGRALGGDG